MSDNLESYAVTKYTYQDFEQILDKAFENSKNNQLADITLISDRDHRRMPAHRLVLAAYSPYFEKRFTEMADTVREIPLEIEGLILGTLMEYCYRGKIVIEGKFVAKLLLAAVNYSMIPLVNICCNYIVKQLNRSNWFQIMSFADLNKIGQLITAAEAYVSQNIVEISKGGEFHKLSFEHLKNIIKSASSGVPSQTDAAESVQLWLKYDELNRRKHYSLPLMEILKVPLSAHQSISIERLGNAASSIISKNQQSTTQKPTVLFLLGGQYPKDGFLCMERRIRYYNSELGTWTHWGNLPIPIIHFGVALFEQNLVIVGGGANPSNIYSTAYKLNLITNSCIKIVSMKVRRIFLGVAVLNGFVYAIGGFDGAPLNTVERLDLQKSPNTWEYVTPMLYYRYAMGAAALKNRLYVAGGFHTRTMDSVEYYDPEMNKWTEVAPMIRPRKNCTAVADNDYLYIIGGENMEYLDTVERYDPDKDQWVQLCSLFSPLCATAAAFCGNRILTIGGERCGNYLDDIQEYNTENNTWTLRAPFENGVRGACAIGVPNLDNRFSS